MKKTVWIIFLWHLCIPAVWAQGGRSVSNVGTTAAPFLEIGVGARAVAMGGAFVGTADDASALHWNPAGIARLSQVELLFVHTDWLCGLDFDFVGAVLPLGRWGSIGASVTALSMSDMPVRTVEMPEGTGEQFSAGDLALALSYGISLTDRFSIGFSGKYIYQSIWKEHAWGLALDIGTLFTTGFRGMRIGAALRNLGTDMRMQGDDLLIYHDPDPKKLGNNERIFADLKTDAWPLPLTFQVGVAMEALRSPMHGLTFAADALHPSDNTESLHLGCEYAFREMFFLRAGYNNLFLRDGEEGLTLGAGLAVRLVGNRSIRVDYAYADFGRLENAHRISVGGSW